MTENRFKEGDHVSLNKLVGNQLLELEGVLKDKDENNKWTIEITSPLNYKGRIWYYQEENNLTKIGGRKSRRGRRKSRCGGRKSRRRGGRRTRGRRKTRRGGRR